VVPMRHVGGSETVTAGTGTQSVFPVPGKMEVGFQMNAFPLVFGHIARGLCHGSWRNIAATVGAVEIHSIVFATKRPQHDLRKM